MNLRIVDADPGKYRWRQVVILLFIAFCLIVTRCGDEIREWTSSEPTKSWTDTDTRDPLVPNSDDPYNLLGNDEIK